MDSHERYEQARDFIRNGEFQAARNVLLPIQHEERAATWIQKIDTRLTEKRSTEQPTKAKPRVNSWVTMTVVAALSFVVGLLVGGYALDLSPEPTQDEIAASTVPVPTQKAMPSATSIPVAEEPQSFGRAIAGNWRFYSDVSALDDSTTYIIALDAEHSVRAWLGDVTPTLYVRCREREYEMFIHAKTQLETTQHDEVATMVRFGEAAPTYFGMSESTTGEAMFFPNAGYAIRPLLNVNQLVVGFTPFNANPVEAIFDTTGIATAIQPLVDECGRP